MGLTFLETAPSALFARFKTVFEAASGRVLYPAQVENLLLKVLAYADAERRIATQYAAEQNLVEHAVGPHLDALGANLETPRLAPRPARCDVVFTLESPAPGLTSFPAGAAVKTADAKMAFLTLAPAYIVGGSTESRPVLAECPAPGAHANGLPPGVVCCIDPALPGASVANTVETYGGGDLEGDGAYRARLLLSHTRFGGGTAEGYRLAALSASPDVADALAVSSADPADGNITIYVLAKDGDAPEGLLGLVRDHCNRPDVRLIGDYAVAARARRVPYEIKAAVKVRLGQDAAVVLDKIRGLAWAYGAARSAALGLDVTPTQALLAPAPLGDAIYSVELEEPSQILEIGPDEWACLAGVDVTYGGTADE
jgi:phage-related baseplate assembly protein